MSPRNMTPDELERFEKNRAQHGEREDVVPPSQAPFGEPDVPEEVDRDRDGLPDEPAKYRVPS